MKKSRISNENLLIIFILSILVIGYSILSSTLKINGVAGINKNTWDIHWNEESIIETPGSVETINPASVTDAKKKVVSFSVELELPGDFYEFKIDAKNYGTIDGKISLSSTKIYNENDEEISLPEYYDYSVKYLDGTNPQNGDVLEAGKSKTYVIRIEFKSTETTLPSDPTPISIKTTIDEEQSKREEPKDDYEETETNTKCENGTIIGDTNWCYANPGSSLEEQKFRYYTSDTTYVESGWATFNDLYGNPQRYYFKDGYTITGWHEENGIKYYFDDEDGDENGYINCNMLYSTNRSIEGVCYNFDEKGHSKEGTGCITNIKFTNKYILTHAEQTRNSWAWPYNNIINMGMWQGVPTNYYYAYKLKVGNYPVRVKGKILVFKNLNQQNGRLLAGFSKDNDINYNNFDVSQTFNQNFTLSSTEANCETYKNYLQDIDVTITEPGEYYFKAVYYMTQNSWSAYSTTCGLTLYQ